MKKKFQNGKESDKRALESQIDNVPAEKGNQNPINASQNPDDQSVDQRRAPSNEKEGQFEAPQEASPLREGVGGYSFARMPGSVLCPLSSYLFFEERSSDLSISVAVPAKTQTWLVAQSFVSSVEHLFPDFDDRVNGLSYDITDAVLQQARNRGALSREVLVNIVQYLSKFRDFIGLSGLSAALDPSHKPDAIDQLDLSSAFDQALDGRVLVGAFHKYLQLGASSKQLLDILNAAFSPGEVNSILDMAVSNVDRYLIRGVLSPAVMRFALEDQIAAGSDWASLVSSLTLENAEEAIRALQELYSFAAATRFLDALGNKISDIAANNNSLATLVQIYNLYSKFEGPVAHIEVKDVIKVSLQAAGFEMPDIHYLPDQLLISEVIGLPHEFNFQCTRLQMMKFYVALLDFFTRRSDSVHSSWDRLHTMRADYAMSLLTLKSASQSSMPYGLTDVLPNSTKSFPYIESHPDWAVVDLAETNYEDTFKNIQALFNRIFVRQVFTLAVTGEVGGFKNRILSLMDERSLERSETWSYVVESNLAADSIYFEAFIRSCQFIKNLALDDLIYYPGDSRPLKDFLYGIFPAVLKTDEVSLLPNSHPGSVFEGANVTQAFFNMYPSSEVLKKIEPWTLNDGMISRAGHDSINYDVRTDEFFEYYESRLRGGSWLDIPSSFPKAVHFYKLAGVLDVDRLVPIPFSGSLLTESDLGQFIFQHPNFTALMNTGYGLSLLRDGSVSFEAFYSPEDISIRKKIPYALAEALWNNPALGDSAIRYILTYTGPRLRYLKLTKQMAPVVLYERENRFGSTIIMGQLPYQATRTFKGAMDLLPDLSVAPNPSPSVTKNSPTQPFDNGALTKEALTEDPSEVLGSL